MGKYFSDAVDQALEAIYYCYDNQKAAAAIPPLMKAAEAGDGDASYILSRCMSGPQYSWKYHPFEENDEGVNHYIRQSILQGSAMGVLGSMRCGMLTPELEEAMPFANLQEAWDVVHEKAQAGSLFCQNMIGNTYFWLDIVRIQGKSADSFPTRQAFGNYLRDCTLACIPWFEKAFRGGMGMAGRNLYNLYASGEEGLVEPQPEKAADIERLGAQLGYPEWQEDYGRELLKKEGREKEGLELCKKSAEQGQLTAWYQVGFAYQEGKLVPKDCRYAMSCYEKGMESPKAIGCANKAGELYFLGKDGIAQDYARAVQLFEKAHGWDNTWGNDMLGLCYLMGWGCRKDPARAKMLLEEVTYSSNVRNYALGLMYVDGIGVAEDIKKGMEYLQKAKNYPPAEEAMLRFKKGIFGGWKRR